MIEWTQASLSHYKLILQVCKNNPNAKNEIREMNALLSQELSYLRNTDSSVT